MKRIAYFGGSFDPVHLGHLAIAHALIKQFGLDEFVFIPAFHAPHKVRTKPTSAYDRHAILCLVTQNETKIGVSKMEIEMPEKPYSVDTLARLSADRPDDEKFFVMGADSWRAIKTWREWEKVLTLSNHIVVTRPGFEIGFSHVTDEIRSRIIDLRKAFSTKPSGNKAEEIIKIGEDQRSGTKNQIFITDSVDMDIAATEIRRKLRENDPSWRKDVPNEVANYVEKYQIYN